MLEPIKNPDRYRELSVPFESEKAMYEAVEAFTKGVSDLRVKHKLPDVAIYMLYKDGEDETNAVMSYYYGDSAKELPLIAQVYGMMRKKWETLIDKMAAGTLKD